ncbi:MAG: tRNA epoxyqueuosine(34) reductase QueG [Tissierellia bacterium]|nr:tRNA epoxyqueuosine(34) reductase QueG [Tissierellia bacterium]
MKEIVKEIGYNLGIKIGISNILDYSYLSEFMINREKNNYNCEFEEQNINKRLNAKNLFPQCKSIIAIGLPYGSGYKIPSLPYKGLLSVSSYGEDYHRKVNFTLNKLAKKLEKYRDFEHIACVDTTFLIDKEICKTAGIGNYGKNSLLINNLKGSFINLGYLLTNIEIETDSIERVDVCGQCKICVRTCPNGAIFPQGGINSKKCISYLTQTKNYIPIEYRENMGRQIYGCDVCQLVCPKNKDVLNKETNSDYSKLAVDLEELLSISNKEFSKRYGSLAGSWRGRNVWKRNALISIGNLRMKSLFQEVKDELSNSSEMIKIYAAWSLLKLDKNLAVDILYNKLKYENENVKSEYLKLMELGL